MVRQPPDLPIDPDLPADGRSGRSNPAILGAVAGGGALGGLGRYALGELLPAGGAGFPWSTFSANLLEKTIEASAASTADPDDARTLKAFGRWGVLQPLRRKYEHKELGTIAVKNVRAVVEDAAGFIAWHHGRSKSLSQCSQADLDEWLATHTSSRQPAQTFIVFAMNDGAMHKLSLPKIVKSPPTAASDLNDVSPWPTGF